MGKAQARAFWAAANVFIGVDVSVCLNMLTRTWWHEERSLDMLEGDRGGVVCILIFGEILKKYVSPLHHISTEYFQNTVNSPQRNQCLLHGPILYVPASLSISGWYMRWMIFCRKKPWAQRTSKGSFKRICSTNRPHIAYIWRLVANMIPSTQIHVMYVYLCIQYTYVCMVHPPPILHPQKFTYLIIEWYLQFKIRLL